ncbi:CBASS cGAMP-activated phospholipase [Mesobacillus foraminis]|uniref:CBASS cGAMP-activated phospholipase n=1 Tax=Mesobacillus foraminis TaxID=279826 RepID=UPI00214C5592|nr:CBASS cGAMP-activated phospholipase [Mesobacillus foraminis]
MNELKILCIDGGGIRGAFVIAVLQAMEEEYKQPIASQFDMVSGTSTGAIIAASAALEKNMSELLKYYRTFGNKIFIRQATVGLFKSMYSDRFLRRMLKKAFGDLALRDINKPLIIPAADITHGKPFVHRTYRGEDKDDSGIKLWDAVLSSCSAPIYFPPNNVDNDYLSIDGGLWANNPSLVCLTEAMHYFNKGIGSVRIFSLGTGKQEIDFSSREKKYWGIRHWLPVEFPSFKVTPKLLDLALDLSSESISYYCSHLIGDHYFRLNTELGKEMPFDDVDFIDQLIDLGRKVFRDNQKQIEEFLEN